MPARRWSELDPRVRQTLQLIGAVEAGLKIGALIDLAQRPSGDVRGSKRAWVLAIALVNSAGAIPLAYFLRGRR
ncbi:MAG TPA: hypothetical protein VL422_08160 [Miltoncostaea sp.]|jgi:hypothetical protein|nr:hypothetical protein [Miltoncostaea sp.]